MCSIICTASAIASENPASVNEELKEKIVKLIGKPDLSHLDGWKFQAEVEFIITRHNQVVVLAVYTSNVFLDEYIKEKLNYRNVGLKGVQRLTPYRIEVNFVKA
jgi:hypothetical protein